MNPGQSTAQTLRLAGLLLALLARISHSLGTEMVRRATEGPLLRSRLPSKSGCTYYVRHRFQKLCFFHQLLVCLCFPLNLKHTRVSRGCVREPADQTSLSGRSRGIKGTELLARPSAPLALRSVADRAGALRWPPAVAEQQVCSRLAQVGCSHRGRSAGDRGPRWWGGQRPGGCGCHPREGRPPPPDTLVEISGNGGSCPGAAEAECRTPACDTLHYHQYPRSH